MSAELHPHDQHGRHGTHDIIPHGAKERSQAEEAIRKAKLPPLTLARDDLPFVVLSERYRDRRIKLSADRLTCEGYKGWASVFATHACNSGRFYFEAEVLEPQLERLQVGWACRYQRFDLPIGANLFSYALSDFGSCSLLHGAHRQAPQLAHAEMKNFQITSGDVIGCYICLPEPVSWPPDPREDSKLYEYLQAGILCSPESPPVPRRSKPEESWIAFSINGRRGTLLGAMSRYFLHSLSLAVQASADFTSKANIVSYCQEALKG
ncbi:ash2-like related protein [Cyclospora cayetanensis]|uniref:Ash2-like related protein n=1 Tax=Cyclospora cayetanensis TaxID=88456 RepID=A0A1D3CXQ4_9EIME|nr:ash2-like related protein [Cyclospora cayetanensis]